MRENIVCRETAPTNASPYMYPIYTFPLKSRKKPKSRKKKDRAEEVGVVHYVLIDPGEGVEHSESLNFDVPEIYT